MLGLAITLFFSIGALGVGEFLLARLSVNLDPALRTGVCGLVGLASLGLLSLPVALLPGGTHWGIFVIGAVALFGLLPAFKNRPKIKAPSGPYLLILVGCVLTAFCSLVGVLAPSDANDWDSLAYHMAAPKMWLLDGQMHFISFIHQSNFPLSIDALYIWGLSWGGESGAKAFSFMFAAYGGVAMFGFARWIYNEAAGWLSLLAYVAIPMVAWEAGTAYVDVGNGLFVALGILFGAAYLKDRTETANVWLSGICLGFAAGTKYTGLQTLLCLGVVLLIAIFAFGPKQGKGETAKRVVLAGLAALLIASPWYVKNVVNTGNPVYPFFFKYLGGKNWDTFSDRIYQEQQQGFGVGREPMPGVVYTQSPLKPTRVGAAILGLAYQPGRYADPAPTSGFGLPFVSLGAVALAGMLAWLISGTAATFEGVAIGTVMLNFGLWFFLSEQSRYIVGLTFVLTVVTGGAAARLRVGALLWGAAAVQLLASVFFLTRFGGPNPLFGEKLKAALGAVSAEEYQKHNIAFYEPAQELNKDAVGGRVALYDEVFGYFLDVPYFWAGPGHTTEMGYEQMQTADELVASLKRLGITYVYINLGETFGSNTDETQLWMNAAGLGSANSPYDPKVRAGKMVDPRDKYKVLLAEAISSGKLLMQARYGKSGTRMIFSVP